MASADLKFLLGITIAAVLWATFLSLYSYGEMTVENGIEYEEQQGFLASLSLSTSFLNPFSDSFQSDIAIISVLIFSVLLAGVTFVALRYIRGQ